MGLWIWTALLFPNGWVYSFASGIRFNFIIAGVALVSHIRSKEKQKFQPGFIGSLVFLFLIWTFLTSQYSLIDGDYAMEQWDKLAKITALFVFILVIIRKKLHIDFVMWCFLFSVGFFATVEGLKYISSGGGHSVTGIFGHVLADNNQLALAFAMTLPISFYLMVEYGKNTGSLNLVCSV